MPSALLRIRTATDTLVIGTVPSFGQRGPRARRLSTEEVRRRLVHALTDRTALAALREFWAVWRAETPRTRFTSDLMLIDMVAAMAGRGSLSAMVLPEMAIRHTPILAKVAHAAPAEISSQRRVAAGTPPRGGAPPLAGSDRPVVGARQPVPSAGSRIRPGPRAALGDDVAPSAAPLNVAGMSPEQRFAFVLKRIGSTPELREKVGDEFEKLFTPEMLAITAGVLAVWAGSHFVGIGFAVDALLLAAGVLFLGRAAWDAAGKIGEVIKIVGTAETERDLDRAASLLAEVIATIGVAVFIAMVTRGMAKAVSGPSKTAGGGLRPPPPQPAAPRQRTVARPAASGGETRGATGFRGNRGFELENAPYQKVRNTPTIINGRKYSGHALDQMQNRGIMPSVVENTVQNGTPFSTRPGTAGLYDPVNKVRVIVNSETGQVVTVIRGAPK